MKHLPKIIIAFALIGIGYLFYHWDWYEVGFYIALAILVTVVGALVYYEKK